MKKSKSLLVIAFGLILIFSLGILSIYNLDLNLGEYEKYTIKKLSFIYIFTSLACFIIGEITKNYSQVDKIWSIMPIIYCWYSTITAFSFFTTINYKMILMSLLVTIWGSRLTYNFYRKGGYSIYFWRGEEDYRWKEVIKKTPFLNNPYIWSCFNLLFICLYQMGLILLFTLPIITITNSSTIGFWDIVLALIILTLIILQSISDNQQFYFQKAKNKSDKNYNHKKDLDRGFISSGLWAYCRHPNFSCEQAIWIFFYFFTISSTGQILNYSIIGCIMLVLLFKGSTDLTEEITCSKYPEYKNYKKRVARIIPYIY